VSRYYLAETASTPGAVLPWSELTASVANLYPAKAPSLAGGLVRPYFASSLLICLVALLAAKLRNFDLSSLLLGIALFSAGLGLTPDFD
jgi:hypothetical protein